MAFCICLSRLPDRPRNRTESRGSTTRPGRIGSEGDPETHMTELPTRMAGVLLTGHGGVESLEYKDRPPRAETCERRGPDACDGDREERRRPQGPRMRHRHRWTAQIARTGGDGPDVKSSLPPTMCVNHCRGRGKRSHPHSHSICWNTACAFRPASVSNCSRWEKAAWSTSTEPKMSPPVSMCARIRSRRLTR